MAARPPALLLRVGLALAGLACGRALAYETDQLTDRLTPLRDSGPEADARVDELLIEALWHTNQQTRCSASTETTRRVLAADIYRATAFHTYVPDRGELAGLGYGAYAAWLETDPSIDRRTFRHYGDIYDHLRPRQSLVLATVGVCSTVRIGNILMGTDKPDHFWSQGYDYFMRSRQGRRDDRATRWGDASERGIYGLATSGVYSYADLEANWSGYQFYKALLTESSPLQRDDKGCVVLRTPFRWVDWLTDAVDEALNPPNYRPSVEAAVRAQIAAERDRVCPAYAVWGPEARMRTAAIRATAHLDPGAPPHEDEWQLDALCGGASGAERIGAP